MGIDWFSWKLGGPLDETAGGTRGAPCEHRRPREGDQTHGGRGRLLHRRVQARAPLARQKGRSWTMTSAKILDPICDMVVDLVEARDQSLTVEYAGREYAFCSPGCKTKFAKDT